MSETATRPDAAASPGSGGQGPARLLRIDPRDNVAVALEDIEAGRGLEHLDSDRGRAGGMGGDGATALEAVKAGHKLALADIAEGEAVVKYGRRIGVATKAIKAYSWVHSHNLSSGLKGRRAFERPAGAPAWAAPAEAAAAPKSFMGYRRRGPGGEPSGAGVRNEIWVIPTVGCIASGAERIAAAARREAWPETWAFAHPYGCSQLGGDLEATRRILAGLVRNPNAGGVLVLALGCENNTLDSFRKAIGPVDPERVRFLTFQDSGDEIEGALSEIRSLAALLSRDAREEIPLAELRVGLKCGGSDGFSGITANPLVGRVSDLLVAAGGSAILTEVPEMFGAEEELLSRASSPAVFDEAVAMIDGFKDYYLRHGQEIYENPSPGNREGGITTLEEKSSGCVRKGGTSPVVEVLRYGGRASKRGLCMLEGPGNDLVSSTAMAAAGVQLILFTTGRGTPYGSPVPTIKISTNSSLAARKPRWIDFDAGRLVSGAGADGLALELLDLVVRVASGERARNEDNGYREIAIFKDGVTL